MHQDQVDYLVQTERWIVGDMDDWTAERGFDLDEVDDEFGVIKVVDADEEVLNELVKSEYLTEAQKAEIVREGHDNVGFYWEY